MDIVCCFPVVVMLSMTGLAQSAYYEPGFGYVNDPQDVFDYDYSDYKFEGWFSRSTHSELNICLLIPKSDL